MEETLPSSLFNFLSFLGRQGVPLSVGGPPARRAAFSRRAARKGFHWKAGGPRPPGPPRPPGCGSGRACAPCHWLVRSKCYRAAPLASTKQMLPLHAIDQCEANAAAPLACAKPASLFLVRSTIPGTLPEVPEVSAQAPVTRSGFAPPRPQARAFQRSGFAPRYTAAVGSVRINGT